MEEIVIENNEWEESYPTKIVIKNNLKSRNYIVSSSNEQLGMHSTACNGGLNALKITLEIDEQGYKKADILEKITSAFDQLKEYFG